MLFGRTFDAIGRIAKLSFRDRDEVANFVKTRRTRAKHHRDKLDELANIETVSHDSILSA